MVRRGARDDAGAGDTMITASRHGDYIALKGSQGPTLIIHQDEAPEIMSQLSILASGSESGDEVVVGSMTMSGLQDDLWPELHVVANGLERGTYQLVARRLA